ncbi:BspA family leucine-rich repeat surface protein [Candidatus Saccharibacteria bacterium]|nr:BspA family leucine-rich repeat surface protein [Candidatus Saccharibacteria bacterium]
MDESCNVVDIAYDGNNADAGTMGAVGTGVIHTGVKDGDSVGLIASNFSRTGYGFAGWSTDPDAGTKLLDNDNTNNPVVYGPQETVTLPNGFTNLDTDNDGVVKLYAVWLQSQGNLQGWMGCSSLDTTTYDSNTGALDLTKKSVTALTDQRDNDTYAVARLADGECWMIENLRLDNTNSDNSTGALAQGYGTSTTYGNFSGLANSENTGFTSSYSANSLYSNNGSNGTINIGTLYSPAYRMPRYNKQNNQSTSANRPQNPTTNSATNSSTRASLYSYGNYYTWHAAIANLTYNEIKNQSTTGTSLCPAGWHLPKGGDKTNEVNNEFWSLVVTGINGGTNPANYENATTPFYTGTPEGANASKALRAFPNNYLYSGYYSTSSANNMGSNGYYWSSTASSSNASYSLLLESSKLNPGTYGFNKYWGLSIRCTVSDPQTYTLAYDANGGTSTPSSQSTTANGIATFTLSNSIPTRSGYTFAGWTDDKGNEAQPGGTFTTKDPNATLYAIWTNNSCNPTATTIGTGNATTDAVCLQDVTPNMKAALPIADATTGTYTLIDARDNQSYTVAKLKDGELWMTKNLNYSSTNTNTPHDTDITSSVFQLPASTTTSNTNNTTATIRTTNNSGNNDNGTYYSWAAAIASTNSYASSNITSSICPKGWDLPINSQYTNLSSKSSFSSNRTDSVPSSFLINGGFTNGATFYDTSYSHFWTSTSNNSTATYGARVNGTTMSTSTNTGTTYGGNKYYRKNLRCIASNGTATIHYNANGGTGTMAGQSGDINAMNAIRLNFFTAPTNRQFRNWNTAADGTGATVTPGVLPSSIVSNGDTITLYAQWDEIYYISFNANESSVGGTASSATGTMANQTVITGAATAIRTNTFALSDYLFYGWNTAADGSGTFYGDEQKVTNLTSTGSTITLYAVWIDGAYLDTGQNVNRKLKRLAGNSSAIYSTEDNTITAIERAYNLPNDFTPSAENTISDSTSPSPIYAWYNSTNTTIYYYSVATNILMNKNSSYFFRNMRALSNLSTVSTWDTTKVTNMSDMFSYTGCNATNWSIGDLSSWNTSSVTSMYNMFRYAGYNATTWSIGDLSDWDTSSVTDMSYMFYQADYSATTWSIGDLSSWNTSSVTNMSYMFYQAGRSATTWSIGDLSSWNTSSVTNMSNMFFQAGYNATTWSIGDLSSWNTSSVTDMSYMFYSASYSATTWSIGDLSDWNTSNVKDMHMMFAYAGYSSLSFILDLSSWNVSSVTNMDTMFDYAGYSATTWSIGNLSSWNTSSVTNMSYMFHRAGYNATTWSIGDLSSWDTSSVTDMSYMFYSAGRNATTFTLDLSDWNTANVTDMNNMFYFSGYSATTFTLDLSSWNTTSVTNMSSMFSSAGRSATTWSVTIPKTNNGTATGPINNTTSNLYGSTTSVTATPPSGKSFTLAN